MHVFKVYRFSTSVVTFKLVFYIILVKGALCIQNQGSKSANTTKTNDTETNIFENSTLIKNSPVGNLSDRKESNSQSPIPLEKITESEKSKKHVFEKDTIYETISPVHEVEQHLTTASNQWIQIPESIEESAGFRPSIHLGEIGEVNFTGIIMKPFNKIQQLGFQKIVNTEANHGSHPRLIRQKLVKFYDTDDRYKPEAIKLQPIPLSEYFHNLQNLHNSESNEHLQNEHVETHYVDKEPIEGMKIIHGILSMRPMKFAEENYNLGTTERPYHQVNLEKPYHLVNFEIPYHPVNAEEAHHQVNVETPHALERPHVVFGNSVKFPNEERFSQPFYTHNHEYNSPLQFEHIEKPKFEFEHIKKPEFEHIKKPEFEFEHIKKPEFEFDQFKKPELEYEKFPNLEIEYDKFKKPGLGLEYYKQPELNCEYSRRPEILVDSFQSEEHGSTENLEKPHNVAYVTTYETTRTRTKKFPYQFYQPMFLSEVPYLHEEHLHEDVSNEKRVSPWKKIIHLLGAAIPIGLLLAALTPRVINTNTDAAADPNIILSKLRVENLPVEHKEGRLVDNNNTCEERSVCESILRGANPKSNFLQNILWNLTNRITDEIAEKNGLHKIFAAVKKNNCGSLTC